MWKLNLLKWLLARLSPRVDPDDNSEESPDEPPEPDDDTPEPDEPPEPDDDTPEPDEPPEPEAKPLSRAQRDIIAARTRAQTAERDLADMRAQLDAARRPAQSLQPTEADRLWQEEEAVLKSPEADSWQKYAVRSARDSRTANINAQNAVLRAEDLADQTRFEQTRATKPKLYEAYKDRVETMLKDVRSKGNNAPRGDLLAYLVGQDMVSGKLKSAATNSTKPVRAATPGARSDVSSSSRGSLSEAERRDKRLENVRI